VGFVAEFTESVYKNQQAIMKNQPVDTGRRYG
jgi:hypothetical protein